MHQPIPVQGRWLTQVVNGYFAYHAVPTNRRALMAFRHHVTDLWRRTLRRRSQKDRPCAASPGAGSLSQKGGCPEEDPWVNGLPDGESQKGQQHAVEAGDGPKACTAALRKTRAIWRKLDCLNPSPQRCNCTCPSITASNREATGIRRGQKSAARTFRPVGDGERARSRGRTGRLRRARDVEHDGKRGIAYGARAPRRRSPRSSPRAGKAVHMAKGGR